MAVTSWIRRQFKNGVTTTAVIPSGCSSGATSFTVGAGQGSTFPDGSVGPFIVTLDQGAAAEEKVLIASRSSDTFTVASNGRGYNGTTAQTHATNATVLHTIDAQDLDEANQVAVQTLGAVTTSGDLLVASGANALARLGRGSAAQFLIVQGSTLAWHTFALSDVPQGSTGQVLSGVTSSAPVWQYPALTSLSSFIGSDVVLTASTPANITSLSLAAGTWVVLGQASITDSNTVSNATAAIWLSTTSAGGTPLGGMGGDVAPNTGGTANVLGFTFSLLVSPSSTTVYYLNAESSQAGHVLYQQAAYGVVNCSGLVAVRIA